MRAVGHPRRSRLMRMQVTETTGDVIGRLVLALVGLGLAALLVGGGLVRVYARELEPLSWAERQCHSYGKSEPSPDCIDEKLDQGRWAPAYPWLVGSAALALLSGFYGLRTAFRIVPRGDDGPWPDYNRSPWDE